VALIKVDAAAAALDDELRDSACISAKGPRGWFGIVSDGAFNATGAVVADPDTATAAGALTTSSLSDRFAYGGSLVQLVTDFGRTNALVGTQRSLAEAQKDLATRTTAQVRLNVRSAYFQVLGAAAVLHAAREAQDNRQLILRQIGALAQSQLRSTLDVSFANVLESEAELAVFRAESSVQQQRLHLATEMGLAQPVKETLPDEALPDPRPPDPTSFVAQANAQRADLNSLCRLNYFPCSRRISCIQR
jgi:outer membrane protein